jgi:hypothetical protein
MSSFKLESSGSFNNLENFLTKMSKGEIFKTLEKYAKEGVDALSRATPLETGETKNSWSSKVIKSRGSFTIIWMNDHETADGDPIVIMLQYGHGTGNGGYVQGRDFINPAMKPVFDNIAEKVWKAVTSA